MMQKKVGVWLFSLFLQTSFLQANLPEHDETNKAVARSFAVGWIGYNALASLYNPFVRKENKVYVPIWRFMQWVKGHAGANKPLQWASMCSAGAFAAITPPAVLHDFLNYLESEKKKQKRSSRE